MVKGDLFCPMRSCRNNGDLKSNKKINIEVNTANGNSRINNIEAKNISERRFTSSKVRQKEQ